MPVPRAPHPCPSPYLPPQSTVHVPPPLPPHLPAIRSFARHSPAASQVAERGPMPSRLAASKAFVEAVAGLGPIEGGAEIRA